MPYTLQKPPDPRPNVSVWDNTYSGWFTYIWKVLNGLIVRKHMASGAVAAAGVQPSLTFRCDVKAVVTKVGVVLGSVSSATLIATLLHNGSVMAVLTLSNSANEVAREFTLSVGRTMDTMLDRLEISAAKDKGDLSVVYDYRIL
jgi:hypothetical protein